MDSNRQHENFIEKPQGIEISMISEFSISHLRRPISKKILISALRMNFNLTKSILIISELDFNLSEEKIYDQFFEKYALNEKEDEIEKKENHDIKYFSIQMPNTSKISKNVQRRNSCVASIRNIKSKYTEKEYTEKNSSDLIDTIPNEREHDFFGVNKKECRICLQNKFIKLFFLNCSHFFCYDCIFNYTKYQIEICSLPIKCPSEGCHQFIEEKAILKIISRDNAIKEKYFKFQRKIEIAKNPDLRFCTNVDCQNVVKKNAISNFVSCNCGMQLCFACGNAWHIGETCEQARDEELRKYMKKANIKSCPNCKEIIEKSEGCNAMKCPKCNYSFCWNCLQEYQIGHYSIFNFKGCPGMDYGNSNEQYKCGKCGRYCYGIFRLILNLLMLLGLFLICYPFLILIIPINLLVRLKHNGYFVNKGKIAKCLSFLFLIIIGIILSVIAYIVAPFCFLAIFFYSCLMNPHVVYPNLNHRQTSSTLNSNNGNQF